MEQLVENILLWIHENPHWAGIAVFVIAFLESLAIIGLAMPGWLLLVGVGTLVGGGSLNFWIMSLSSFAGAFAGQSISFAVGFYYKDRVHHWGWIERHQSLLEKSETFFKRHGFSGILIAQFVGPIRAVISLMAGILEMPVKNFMLAVMIATMIWAPFYLIPGVLIGAALTFEKTQMWVLMGALLAIVSSLWLIGRFVLDFYREKKVTLLHKTSKPLYKAVTKKRWLAFAGSISMLVAILTFLWLSNYGNLMLDLLNKILMVVS